MCGLIGVAGNVSAQVKNSLFKDMLDVCQTRGRHATGVIKVDDDLDYGYIKNVGPPAMLFDRRSYSDIVETGNAAALIGHCRHKTSGDNDTASAHPFDYEDEGIIGVHNGTLRSYHDLDTHNFKKVDSEVLYGHLAMNGPEETFNKIEGAWACVWWNDKNKTLNFIRNKERPLWFTWNEDCSMMFWASEIWMFGAISRKIKLWDGGKADSPYVELPVDTMWSFNIDPKAKKDEKPLTMKTPHKIEAKKPVVRGYQGNRNTSRGGNSWRNGDDWYEANGVWTRKGLAGPNADKGGEVTNPFPKDGLNDDVSDIGREPEQSNTQIGNVSFIHNSPKQSDTGADTKLSKKSTRSILSLPERTSGTCQQGNNGGRLNASGKRQDNTILNLPKPLNPVSLRTVAGMDYITDEKSKKEFGVLQFEENTGGKCCFCKQPVGDLQEVAEFLNEKQFLCTSCVEEPNSIELYA